MNLKNLLKAALNSFLNLSAKTPKIIIQEKEPEPSLVFNNQLLAGKNVLITGAGQNIGKSIALEIAQQGANIYCTSCCYQVHIFMVLGNRE